MSHYLFGDSSKLHISDNVTNKHLLLLLLVSFFSFFFFQIRDNIGYPVAECAADGKFILSKPPNTGGLVSPSSVSEQVTDIFSSL